MKKFAFICIVALGLTAILALGAKRFSGSTETEQDRLSPPNIAVISLCSVRPDHMSVYGYARQTTPHLQRLASDAIVFENAVSQWPKTTPAFATLLTGKFGHSTGVMRVTPLQHLGEEHKTLAEIFRENGYRTAAFVSSSALSRSTNIFQQGFDVVEETFRRKEPFLNTTRLALTWIEANRDRPFVAWVHYNNAHQPYVAPGAPPEKFVGDEHYWPGPSIPVNEIQELSLNVALDHPFRRQILRPDMGGARPQVVLPGKPLKHGYYVARYDAGILGADRMAGLFLQELRENGFFENTIIAVVGDHGESLGEHDYYFGHGRLPYDSSAKVPLIIRPPGGTDQKKIDEPVAAFALGPTLLDMAGIQSPPEMEATSLVPRLKASQATSAPNYVFSESGYQLDYNLTVRDKEWKLLFIPNPVDQALMTGNLYELYELSKDPQELENVYGREREHARRLRRILLRWSRPWVRKAYQDIPSTGSDPDVETLEGLRALGYLD